MQEYPNTSLTGPNTSIDNPAQRGPVRPGPGKPTERLADLILTALATTRAAEHEYGRMVRGEVPGREELDAARLADDLAQRAVWIRMCEVAPGEMTTPKGTA